MCTAPVVTKSCVVSWVLMGHLGSCWCTGSMLYLGPYRSKWHILLCRAAGQCCIWGPCLGLWPDCNHRLCWCLGSGKPPECMFVTECHEDLSSLHCYPMLWWHPTYRYSWESCLSPGSYCSQGSCCHQKLHERMESGHNLWLCWCLGSMLPPEPSWSEWPLRLPRARMLSTPKLLPRAMSVFMVLLQLRSVLMSVPHIPSGSHRNHSW